jgi:SAM-dependent methyltransferase
MPYTAFDRFVARQRFRVVLPLIGQDTRVCDLGAGVETGFLRIARSRIKFGVGVDRVKPEPHPELFPFVRGDISAGVPLRGGGFHHVVMLAVLEHLSEPERVLREAQRILAPGGSLIITYPSSAVDPILKVMDWIGSVSPDSGFDQHQPRIPIPTLVALLGKVGFEEISHRKFELGLNNLLVAFKPGSGLASGIRSMHV